MTTATEHLIAPPSIDAAELEPLLADRERACELPLFQRMGACERPAAWLVTVIGPCECSDTQRRTFAWCDPHTIRARRIGVGCARCDTTLAVGWIELLRSPP